MKSNRAPRLNEYFMRMCRSCCEGEKGKRRCCERRGRRKVVITSKNVSKHILCHCYNIHLYINMIFLLHTQDSNSHMSPESRQHKLKLEWKKKPEANVASTEAWSSLEMKHCQLTCALKGSLGRPSDWCTVLRQTFKTSKWNPVVSRWHHSRASSPNLLTFPLQIQNKSEKKASTKTELCHEEARNTQLDDVKNVARNVFPAISRENIEVMSFGVFRLK